MGGIYPKMWHNKLKIKVKGIKLGTWSGLHDAGQRTPSIGPSDDDVIIINAEASN